MQGRRPTIFGDGSQSRDFLYVGNVVDANLLAARAANVSGQVFNVGSGQSLSVRDLLQQICERLNVRFDPIFAPPRAGDIQDSWADISAAQRELGYRPQVSLADGLQRTIDDSAKRLL